MTLIAAVALERVYPFAIAFASGVSLVGFLLEYANRYPSGSLCFPSLALGGILLSILDWQFGIGLGAASFYAQFIAAVLIWWGLLMFVISPRQGNTPERNFEM
jgi:hypothetical protein